MLEYIHKGKDHFTTWLRPKINKALLVHWETNKGFKHQRLTNRANRASARLSKYTGGLATFMKTKAMLICSFFNFSKLLDHDTTLAKTFKCIHTLKENKERFADQRKVGEDAEGSAASVVDPGAVWRETASAPKKNHIYGLGSFSASSLRTFMLKPSSASTTRQVVDSEKCIDLRLQVQELTRILHEQAQKLTGYQERYQKILTRRTDMDELSLEWREQLERLQLMEAGSDRGVPRSNAHR
ncbi:hypothetical protein Ahy_A02g007138 [Arachis hypogaea]|uniref:Uncharacterized protein n=1 Tax=Arachis hypogaea TaxID=3818 RepID=A0A445ECB6_ARAHY|nr:hypothetical protein Ahy_A02g007138 [Arachis hypogaea]